jgi:hypothetical protein
VHHVGFTTLILYYDARPTKQNITYIRSFPSIFHIKKTVSGREDDALLTGLMMVDNDFGGIWKEEGVA